MLARSLPIAFLIALLCAAGAQAATVKVPVPAEGEVAVAVASVPKRKVALRVTKAPAAVAVTGSAKHGRLAVAVMRPHGTFGAGSVTISVRGKAKGVKRYATGASAPKAVCRTLGALLGKPMRTAGLARGDLRAAGAAVAARLCGRPAPSDVLARLGLGAAAPGGVIPGGSPAPPPPPAGEPGNQCANGIDDDHDGQVDAASERRLRPDPGCMNANDPTETGEVALAGTCDASVAIGDDPSQLNVGINAGCGSFTEVAVYAAPSAFVCDIQASAGNWGCVIAHGQAFAQTLNATDADMADLQISLLGAADCSVPATIVLYRRDFTVAERVAPIAACS